jgi:hypothetical protein
LEEFGGPISSNGVRVLEADFGPGILRIGPVMLFGNSKHHAVDRA